MEIEEKPLNIYFIHSLKSNFNKNLYLPVLRSNLLSKHHLIFSQTEENKNKYYKDLIASADLIVIELSDTDMTLNMEIKEAAMSRKPLLVLAHKVRGYDDKYQAIVKNIIGYGSEEELRHYVETFVNNYKDRISQGKLDPTVVLGVLKQSN